MASEPRASSSADGRAWLVSGVLLVGMAFGTSTRVDAAPPSLADLRCEDEVDPIGIGSPAPRLSWQLRSDEPEAVQSAYRIQVGRSREGWRDEDIYWDSGKVASSQSIQVRYEGPLLDSARRYSWRVRVWDGNGEASEWSALAYWEMGLLEPEDWQSLWITPGLEEDTSRPQPAPLLRRTFTIEGFVESARAYVTSLGLYEMEINGRRVGDQRLTPGWTREGEPLPYQTYDVTDLLRRGRNVVGATLGDGWYRGHTGWGETERRYGKELALLFQLRATLEDGTSQIVGTDETWKSATGPILHSDIYRGEDYDARLERPGWSAPGYDDGDWASVRVVDHSKANLVAPTGPPVRRTGVVRPVEILRTPAGETVVDMGQSLVGWVRVEVIGVEGSRITLRHAEALDKEGNFPAGSPQTGTQLVTYTLQGGVDETYEPRFTFQEFRYVAVDGYPAGRLSPDSLTGMAIHSDMRRTRKAAPRPPKE